RPGRHVDQRAEGRVVRSQEGRGPRKAAHAVAPPRFVSFASVSAYQDDADAGLTLTRQLLILLIARAADAAGDPGRGQCSDATDDVPEALPMIEAAEVVARAGGEARAPAGAAWRRRRRDGDGSVERHVVE